MKTRRMCGVLALYAVLATTLAWAEDSPQFRGTERTGLSKETGLLKSWPEGGPKLPWTSRKLGHGPGTPSVAKGHVVGDDDQAVRFDDEMAKGGPDPRTGAGH